MKCILDYQTLNWSPVCVRILFSNLTKQTQSLPSDNLSLSSEKCMLCDWYARMVWYTKHNWHLACNAVKWLLVDIVINLHDNQYFLNWYLTSIITAYLIQIIFCSGVLWHSMYLCYINTWLITKHWCSVWYIPYHLKHRGNHQGIQWHSLGNQYVHSGWSLVCSLSDSTPVTLYTCFSENILASIYVW